MLKKFFFVFIFLSGLLFSQEYDYQYEFGKFSSADAFSVNSSGNIYIIDKETNEIYKYDTAGHELKSIGGYGWDEGAFDNPVSIFSTVLYVYVTDKNNHRVQIFDKDLNFLSQIKRNDELKFGYPVGCVTSTLGDIFILDSENKQILKLNSSGQLISQFANYQSGEFELNSPAGMAVSPDNKLLVLDNGSITVYDQYGNGIGKIKLDFNAEKINVTQDYMTINSADIIYTSDLREKGSGLKELMLRGYDLNNDIAAGLIFKDMLYVLTAHQVIVYKKKKAE